MDMKLSEEQRQLRDTARKYVARESAIAFVREMEKSELGFSRAMWEQMGEMGWLAMGVPEKYDGLGMGHVDLVVLAQELGRGICPTPFFTSAVLCADAIARGGTEAQKSDLLPRMAAGELIVAFAYQEASRKFAPGEVTRATATRDGDEYVLSGTKLFVEFAAGADKLLVTARSSGQAPSAAGLSMFLVDREAAGVHVTHMPTMARDRCYEVKLDEVRVPASALLGELDHASLILEAVLERGAVMHSAHAVGMAQWMHESATAFAKERVQFGRPIGQMQIIQQYLATLIIEIHGAETLTYYTAWTMDRQRPQRELVAKTKAFAGYMVEHTMDRGAQIFGGMGYIEETNETLYLRRGKQHQLAFGGMDHWEDIIADEMLADA